jgi:hypothetical protein
VLAEPSLHPAAQLIVGKRAVDDVLDLGACRQPTRLDQGRQVGKVSATAACAQLTIRSASGSATERCRAILGYFE